MADRSAPDLDVRGLFCPLPVLLAQRALDPLPAGARISVLGDDPAIHGDVPAWCAEAGHRLVELVELAGEEIRFVVEKAGAPEAAQSASGTGNPRSRISAATSASRPRKAR